MQMAHSAICAVSTCPCVYIILMYCKPVAQTSVKQSVAACSPGTCFFLPQTIVYYYYYSFNQPSVPQ